MAGFSFEIHVHTATSKYSSTEDDPTICFCLADGSWTEEEVFFTEKASKGSVESKAFTTNGRPLQLKLRLEGKDGWKYDHIQILEHDSTFSDIYKGESHMIDGNGLHAPVERTYDIPPYNIPEENAPEDDYGFTNSPEENAAAAKIQNRFRAAKASPPKEQIEEPAAVPNPEEATAPTDYGEPPELAPEEPVPAKPAPAKRKPTSARSAHAKPVRAPDTPRPARAASLPMPPSTGYPYGFDFPFGPTYSTGFPLSYSADPWSSTGPTYLSSDSYPSTPYFSAPGSYLSTSFSSPPGSYPSAPYYGAPAAPPAPFVGPAFGAHTFAGATFPAAAPAFAGPTFPAAAPAFAGPTFPAAPTLFSPRSYADPFSSSLPFAGAGLPSPRFLWPTPY